MHNIALGTLVKCFRQINKEALLFCLLSNMLENDQSSLVFPELFCDRALVFFVLMMNNTVSNGIVTVRTLLP